MGKAIEDSGKDSSAFSATKFYFFYFLFLDSLEEVKKMRGV